MKKNYVKPSIEVIKVNATSMLASSTVMSIGKGTVNSYDEETQLSRENRGSSFGNIWDSQW
jgi:hypothetical protein